MRESYHSGPARHIAFTFPRGKNPTPASLEWGTLRVFYPTDPSEPPTQADGPGWYNDAPSVLALLLPSLCGTHEILFIGSEASASAVRPSGAANAAG